MAWNRQATSESTSHTQRTSERTCLPAVSSPHSSDPELNGAHAVDVLLNANGAGGSRKDAVVSDDIPPYVFDMLFPMTPFPDPLPDVQTEAQSTADHQKKDALQLPSSGSPGYSCQPSLDNLLFMPIPNPIPSLSQPGTSSSMQSPSLPPLLTSSGAEVLCTINNEDAKTEETASTADHKMEVFFDLLSLIPLSELANSPPPECSQPVPVTNSTCTTVDALLPPASAAHTAVSGSVSVPPLLEPTSSQAMRCSLVPTQSTCDPDFRRNNTPHALMGESSCSQEHTMWSGDVSPGILDLPLFLFPPASLPEITSQEAPRPPPMKHSIQTTVIAHTAVTDSVSVPLFQQSITTSPQPANCAPVSTIPTNHELERNDALHLPLGDIRYSQESAMVSDGVAPSILDLPYFLFPPAPHPQGSGLTPQEASQPMSVEQSAQLPVSAVHAAVSGNFSIPSLQQSMAITTSPQPHNYTLHSTNSSNHELEGNNTLPGEQPTIVCNSTCMAPSILDLPSFLFPPAPHPEGSGLSSQEVSQPTSVEQSIQSPTSVGHDTISGSLSVPPLPESTIMPSHPSSCVPVSNDIITSTDITPYTFDFLFSLTPLSPLPKSPDLLSARGSQSAPKLQDDETTLPPPSTAHSHLDNLCPSPVPNLPPPPLSSFSTLPLSMQSGAGPEVSSTGEDTGSEIGCFFDFFSLLPLPLSTDSHSLVQRTNTTPLHTSPTPDQLQGDEAIDRQIKNSVLSQASISFMPEDKAGTSVSVAVTSPSSWTGVNTVIPSTSFKESHAALTTTQLSIATSSPSPPPSDSHLYTNSVPQEQLVSRALRMARETKEQSTQASSTMETDSNAKSQNCTNVKPKSMRTLSAEQQQRQRELNRVCALSYRRRRKNKSSSLEVRRQHLEATNKRLHARVSALTAEIEKLKMRNLSKSAQKKSCSFVIRSTCRESN